MKKTIVIVGAGTGLGNHIAKKFGNNNFRIILVSRNIKNLEQYQKDFTNEGIETHIRTANAENNDSLTQVFNQIKSTFGVPDVLVYNVGITTPSSPAETTSEDLARHYQIDVIGAYHSIKQILGQEFQKKKGVILLTGGGLALNPEPSFTALSLDKAAIRSLAFLLNKELSSKNIFVGTITIKGGIKPDTHFSPALIAEKYWELFTTKDSWEIVYE